MAAEVVAAAAAEVVAAVDPVLETPVIIINDVSAYHPSHFRNPRVCIRFHVDDARKHKRIHSDVVRFFRLDHCRAIVYYSY